MQNYFQRSTMFLFFNGCSYTQGIRLENKKKQRFSTLVSNHYSADHVNISYAGGSNDKIVESTMEWLKDNTCDYGVILLTHCARLKLNKDIIPGSIQSSIDCDIKRVFYENFYDDEVGATNFYKNRYILEQAFEKKGIPLILMQYVPLPWQGTNIWREMCNGELPLVAKTMNYAYELSPKIKTILGRIKNKEYYWLEHEKRIDGHFNFKGHRKVADFIISQIDRH